MIVYINLFLLTAVNYIRKQKYTLPLLILFFILSAFRWEVGTDFQSYLKGYDILYYNGFGNLRFEIGNVVLYYIAIAFENVRIYFILNAFLILFFLYKTMKNYSSKYKSGILLFFLITNTYFMSFNIMRQTLGIMIILFGIRYIHEKNFLKYCLTVLLATLFHKTSILALFFYFLGKIKIKKEKVLIVILILSLFTSEILLRALEIVLLRIPSMSYYLRYFIEKNLELSIIQLAVKALRTVILLKVIFDKKHRGDEKYSTLFFLWYSGVVAYNVLPGWMGRIAFPLLSVEILFLPQLLKRKKIKWLKLLILSSYIGRFLLSVYIGGNGILPYRMF